MENSEWNDSTNLKLNAVVYAYDFSVCSQNAGLYAALLAKTFSTKLIVAHAFSLSQAAMEVEIEDSLISRQRTDLSLLLSQKAQSLASGSIPTTSVLLDGDPKTMLLDLAVGNAPSLIVMGTHGRGWIRREFIGSVAEAVLQSSSSPCLTVGPHVPSVSARPSPVRRILYVTDFTPAAAGAAAYAVAFALAFGAEIDILNVIRKGAIDHPERMQDLSDRFYQALENTVPHKAEEFSHPKTFVEIGDAHTQILRHIQECSIDLLVLGIEKASH